jgi:Protein of unknown function (DUF2971)
MGDIDNFEEQRPKPTATLYKYVHPERLDVLQNAEIRFTPPLNTNDIFEVRQTFEMLAGPKFQELFREQAESIDIDQQLEAAAAEAGLQMPASTLKLLAGDLLGIDVESFVKNTLSQVLENQLYPMMNSSEKISDLLEQLGKNLLCLSLTEKMDSSPMWAHYADNSNGFVIAFNSEHSFFRRGEGGERQGLQKISYFDGKMAEMLDDPYGALMSKQADWAYEREWRLYVKADEASRVIPATSGDIHLVALPRDTINRVILGLRASDQLEKDIKAIIADRYSEAIPITRVVADRKTAQLSEVSG